MRKWQGPTCPWWETEHGDTRKEAGIGTSAGKADISCPQTNPWTQTTSTACGTQGHRLFAIACARICRHSWFWHCFPGAHLVNKKQRCPRARYVWHGSQKNRRPSRHSFSQGTSQRGGGQEKAPHSANLEWARQPLWRTHAVREGWEWNREGQIPLHSECFSYFNLCIPLLLLQESCM